ncbi:MAG: citrate lyase acyl carrier protein [Peptococcaceae bacterium]|nr:citrate lyase acyl carrier protein [Peptococcaceae bacterium]
MSVQIKPSQAGTLESSDILIMLAPAEPGTGISIELVSPTIHQFGDQIKKVITDTLQANGIKDILVHANDKGAWDYAVEARVKTAILRAIS